uniref:Uncharacterized protein n=1 Tax=Ditylenchus dipsaci TaxID=166011 RepID=A0A915D829_9BILA
MSKKFTTIFKSDFERLGKNQVRRIKSRAFRVLARKRNVRLTLKYWINIRRPFTVQTEKEVVQAKASLSGEKKADKLPLKFRSSLKIPLKVRARKSEVLTGVEQESMAKLTAEKALMKFSLKLRSSLEISFKVQRRKSMVMNFKTSGFKSVM